MPTATEDFFTELNERGHDPLLRRTKGSIRFDLDADGTTQRWLVEVDKGDIAVTRRNRKADSVVLGDLAEFDQIVRGTDNAVAALLRGTIYTEGDLQLLMLFQRLIPGPAGNRSARKGG